MCNRYFHRMLSGLLLLLAVALPSTASSVLHAPASETAAVARSRPYRQEECAYCGAETWCEIRANGKPQCRACKVERWFECVVYPPLGYRLQRWQRDDLRALYGNVRPETGLRIYRKGYWSMGKQNGKTFIVAGLPLYHLECEDEFQPQAYVVASAKDQAGVAFQASALLVNSNANLKARFKVIESVKRIVRRDGNGIFAVLAADGDVQDGKRPSLLLFDELHRFTRKKAETARTVLMKGFLSRDIVKNGVAYGEPLMLQTTTSGDEFESPMWAHEYEYAQKVINNPSHDPAYFARIYQADPKRIVSDPEYWKSKEARVAANPSHEENGGFVSDAVLEKEMLEAVRRPEQYTDYIRLNLNVPMVATATPIVNMPTWYANGGPDDLRDWPAYDVDRLILKWGLKGRRCYAGGDLGWTTDMTALSLVFPPEDEEEKWKLLFLPWLPEARVAEIERITRAPLREWVRRDFIATVPGVKMKLLEVEDKVRWAADTFELKEFCFDPWGGLKRSAEVLAEEGIPCTEIDQNIKALTAATKGFLTMYMNHEFLHGNNPVMNWHVSCLSLDRDHSANVKPEKPAADIAKKRIDCVAATINALARALVVEKKSALEERGIRTI